MRILIVLIIIVCIGGCISLVALNKLSEKPILSASEENLDELTIEELFERGQYYFNHDEDKEGPYDLQKARKYYENILRKDLQGHEYVWYQLGRIDFIVGDFDAALYKFGKQVEYFGDRVPNVYYMIGLTHGFKARESNSAEDWVKGEEGFKKYIEFDPTAPWPRVDLSWIYFSQGKFEEMLQPLEGGLEYAPENPWLHNMYGLALLNTGDAEGAHAHFKSAQDFAEKLSIADWGRSYPGNDPAQWELGLSSFKSAIEKNLELSLMKLN